MIKHIVFWTLQEEASGRAAAENAALIKSKLEALGGKIPGLLHIEVGIDISRSDASADVALYTELETASALEAYQVHPLHQEVAEFIGQVRAGRIVVDYEV